MKETMKKPMKKPVNELWPGQVPLITALVACAVLTLSGCDSGSGSKDASVRLLNVSPGYQSLDLYANKDDDSTDQRKLEAVTYENVSNSATLDSDTYSIKFKRNGVTSTLRTLSGENLADESHAAYVAYGSNGHFATLEINEDISEPDGGQSKVHVLNTAEAGTVDLYLTEESASLDDATPQFDNVGHGSMVSNVVIDSGTYRLRVTGAGDTDDLRLDVPEVTFGSKQVASVILTATEGGVLVNAVILPQQGSVTTHHNTKARVRGAVGIANGSSVTASVGGVSLLANAAVGVISSRYSQVEAGNAAVSISVDGNPVNVASQTLTAGGEYTLLVWSDANGTQTTMISDDNRTPGTSGKTKIRLMNGISGFAVPITLAVDFSPIAEGIVLGQASSFTEVDSGSDYQLDVTDTNTAASLLTRTGVTLQDGSVYTMFMSGSGSTASGTLRKDR